MYTETLSKFGFLVLRKLVTLTFLALIFSLLFFNKTKIEQFLRFTKSEIDIREKISSIPLKDLEKLEIFFKILIKDFDFAYTLFGEKPCSIAGYMKTVQHPQAMLALKYFESPIFEKGWETWCKYAHLFPSKNFILKKFVEEGSPEFRTILIINKKALLPVLIANKEIIQKYLQAPLNPEEILEKIITEDDNICLLSNGIIEGILLGYGASNASLFERCYDLSLMINKNSAPPFQCQWDNLSELGLIFVRGYSKHNQKLSSEHFNNLEETNALIAELNYLTDTRECFTLPNGNQLLEDFHSPVFVGISNNSETKALSEIYLNDREKILRAYQGKSFMEVTLDQWINN